MEVADLFFLGLVAISAIIGLFRGLMREALSLVAWVLAFVIAVRFGPMAADYLTPYVSVQSVRMATAYSVLFIAVLIVGAVINFFLGKMVRATGFSGTDRTLGLLFGVARGVVVIVLAIMMARLTVVKDDAWWKESVAIQYLEPWAEKAREWLPDNLNDQMKDMQAAPMGKTEKSQAPSNDQPAKPDSPEDTTKPNP